MEQDATKAGWFLFEDCCTIVESTVSIAFGRVERIHGTRYLMNCNLGNSNGCSTLWWTFIQSLLFKYGRTRRDY